MSNLVGLNATGSQSAYGSFNPNDGAVACKFTASQSGTATSIFARISLGGTGYKYRCAIYDSAGTTKLGDTVELTNPAAGWQQFTLNSNVSITSGTDYYLVIMTDGDFAWLETDGGGFVDEQMTLTYPTWPSNVHSGSYVGNGHPSIYADGSTATATGNLAATESGSDTLAASGGVGSNGVRLTLRDTDTGALATSLSGLIVSIRAASNSTSVLASTTSGTTDGSGVFQLASTAIGSIGTFVYVTVEKSDHSIVAAYRVQVIDLNA